MWGSTLDKMQQLLQAQTNQNKVLVHEYLKDHISALREVAVMVLSEIGSHNDMPHLIPLIDDNVLNVRLAAIASIEHLAQPEDITLLQTCAQKEHDEATKNALCIALERLQKRCNHA